MLLGPWALHTSVIEHVIQLLGVEGTVQAAGLWLLLPKHHDENHRLDCVRIILLFGECDCFALHSHVILRKKASIFCSGQCPKELSCGHHTTNFILFCSFHVMQVASPPLPPKRPVFTSVLDSVKVSLPIKVGLQGSLGGWRYSIVTLAPPPSLESIASAPWPRRLPLPSVAVVHQRTLHVKPLPLFKQVISVLF